MKIEVYRLFKAINPTIKEHEIQIVFDFFDENKDGFVNAFELKTLLKYD